MWFLAFIGIVIVVCIWNWVDQRQTRHQKEDYKNFSQFFQDNDYKRWSKTDDEIRKKYGK